MTYGNYHIDHIPTNKLIGLAIVALGVFAVVVKRKRNRYWKTGVVVKLNKSLSQSYTYSEGLKEIVKEFDKEKAKAEYATAKRELDLFREKYSKLEKVNFLNNPDTQELAENTLSNYYTIEGILANLAFADGVVPEDKHLIEIASNLSLSSLHG